MIQNPRTNRKTKGIEYCIEKGGLGTRKRKKERMREEKDKGETKERERVENAAIL